MTYITDQRRAEIEAEEHVRMDVRQKRVVKGALIGALTFIVVLAFLFGLMAAVNAP